MIPSISSVPSSSSSPPKPEVKKRKRPDRSAKVIGRKEFSETVVKSSLLRYIQGDGDVKSNIFNAIKERVEAYSKRMNLASIAISECIKELFMSVEDVRNVVIPDLLDQTFIRQFILGTDGAQQAIPMVAQFYRRHPEYQIVKIRHSADRNIYSSGAIKYITNLKNAFNIPFISRVRKFTSEYSTLHGLSTIDQKAMMCLINGWNIPKQYGKCFPLNEHIVTTIFTHRRVLDLAEGAQVSTKWLKKRSNMENIVRYFGLLNRFKEENGLPTFNIVPICRMGAHFMTIDSSSLYGIMKDLKLVNSNVETFMELADDHWRSFINISKIEGKQNKFTGTIETDGIAMCSHFKRPKNINDEVTGNNTIQICPNDRVIAIDPGRENIFFGAELLENGKYKSYRLTRRHYYQQAGIFEARKKSEHWNLGVQQELSDLSLVSSKGIDLVNHIFYKITYLRHFDSLWSEYLKPRWARQRLRLYGGKKRVFANFFNKIKNGGDTSRRVVIAYGSAKFAPGGRNELSVPTTRAFKDCSIAFPTIVVDEFRSTIIHHEDDSVLQYIKRRDKDTTLRGLLWCNSPNNNKFVNRDLNAAINIRRCAVSQVRPIILQRLETNVKLAKVIGKVIKC